MRAAEFLADGFQRVHHIDQTVGAGRRQMLLQTDGIDEIKIHGRDVAGLLIRQHPNQQSDDAFGDDRIAVGRELDHAAVHFGAQPHLTLTTANQMAVGFVSRIDQGQFFSEVNQVFISIGPLIEQTEFLDDSVLDLVDVHDSDLPTTATSHRR